MREGRENLAKFWLYKVISASFSDWHNSCITEQKLTVALFYLFISQRCSSDSGGTQWEYLIASTLIYGNSMKIMVFGELLFSFITCVCMVLDVLMHFVNGECVVTQGLLRLVPS
jgi:hypothetical protein